MQQLIAFIEAPALDTKRRMVEEDPAFLTEEAERGLTDLAAAQSEEETRQVIEAHRALLARCRAVGIAAAFEEVAAASFERLLNEVCDDVVTLLIEGDAAQRAEVADYLTELASQPLPIEGAERFARLLAAWLRGEPTDEPAAALAPSFRAAYEAMAEAVAAEMEGDEGEEDGEADEVLNLLAIVAALLTQGTPTEREQMAGNLAPMQAEAQGQDDALATFLGCLVAALRGDEANSAALVGPYAELWAILQEAVAEADERDHEATGGDE